MCKLTCEYDQMRLIKCFSLRNLMKQLFHSRLLDMRLVIANSELRPSLAITISYPTRAHGIIILLIILLSLC